MPRYFFIFVKDKRVLDTTGKDFTHLADAEHHARAVAADLAWNTPAHELAGAYILTVGADAKEVFRVALVESS